MYQKVFRSLFVLILVVGLVVVQAPKPVYAATLTVTNNNDSGPGSLRQAILDASDGDTIDFDANYTITLNSQLPVIDKTLTINGNGATNTIIEASNCNPVNYPGGCTIATYRVLEVGITGNLTLDSLTIRHGLGGIYSAGTLTVMNSTVSYNNTGGFGGGIYVNQGSLTVTGSVLSDNGASDGGGIYNKGTTTITDSTFSGNFADDSYYGYGWGGGVFNEHILTVINSTFFNNYAYIDGGGIENAGTLGGTLTVINSTFSENWGDVAGGINNNSGTLHLINTILANSNSGVDCYNQYGDVIVTNINNLIEVNGSAGHMCGTPVASADPNLGPLQDNGGPTQTMALLSGSPAIDAGDNATCESTDQRGIARPQGAVCDIGAFELEVANPTLDVSIDIKPGSDTNPINTMSKGTIPVGILSTPDFDAPSMVDVSSLTFGELGDEESLALCNDNGEDVNGDGLLDLVCHFYTQATNFQIGDLEGILKGVTIDGISIEGSDDFTILR